MERTPLPPFSFAPSLLSDEAFARGADSCVPLAAVDPLAYARIAGPISNPILDDVTWKPA